MLIVLVIIAVLLGFIAAGLAPSLNTVVASLKTIEQLLGRIEDQLIKQGQQED